MIGNKCRKTILKTAGISILVALFYTGCDDNGVKVVTPEVTTFEDKRDGKIYKKVQIGSQIWMAENLNYVADGSKCGESWNRTPAQNCEDYGRLYDWYTGMDGVESSHANPSGVEGVCPVGWHIPSDAEWTELIGYVGVNAGTKLKSREFKGNREHQTPDGTDKYRFSALMGPYSSHWWSATERDSDEELAWIRSLNYIETNVNRVSYEKHRFLSVRCVHD